MSDEPSRERYIIFPLTGGDRVEIRLTRSVTKKEFERIKDVLDLMEESFVKEQQPSGQEEAK